MAERVGFEPTVRFWRTHDFQSCSFDPSDISPCAGRLWSFARPLVDNLDYYIILFSLWQLKIAYCTDFFLVYKPQSVAIETSVRSHFDYRSATLSGFFGYSEVCEVVYAHSVG